MLVILFLVCVISTTSVRSFLFSLSCHNYEYLCYSYFHLNSLYYSREVCGTDGLTYNSLCDLTNATCKEHKSVSYAYYGNCLPAHHLSSTVTNDRHSTTHAHTLHLKTTSVTNSPLTSDVTSTTMAPSTSHDAGRILDLLCLQLSHEDCPKETSEVCGSNNYTYVNYCEYEKARCTHRHLTILHKGACT